MKISIGSDHHGIQTRSLIIEYLQAQGHAVDDMGTCENKSVDYPDIAAAVAEEVSRGNADRGILLCGSGIGMSIAANKFHGVRAAACYDEHSAEMCRRHNDANVLCLSDDMIGPVRNLRLVKIWLQTEFEGGRHARRVDKISALESA